MVAGLMYGGNRDQHQRSDSRRHRNAAETVELQDIVIQAPSPESLCAVQRLESWV